MNKNKIGYLILTSAIIWGAVIVGCSFALKGTTGYEKINFILIGGVVFHFLFIWAPLAKTYREKKE